MQIDLWFAGLLPVSKHAKKLFLVMKLTVIIILSACLTASADGYSQKVTLSEKNASLEKVFATIKKQTGYEFLYTDEMLQQTSRVTLELKNVELHEALEACFKNQPVTYTIIEKTVIIKPKEPEPKKENLPPPTIDVKGKVINENGEPVAGVSVIVKGTKKGTTTNAEGEFTLNGVDSKAIIIFSGTNISGLEIKLNGKTELNVMATIKISKLDEMLIVAYGTNTQRYNVGSVAKITSEDIEKQPVNNVLLALEGRVPGLYISPTSGIPGAAVKVQLRGQNSLQSSLFANSKPFDQPLFIVDGTPMAAQNGNTNLLSSLGAGYVDGFTNSGGFSPLNTINPADIESISFLKDADATSIYGTQGANGVIIINTKKGKAGKTTLDISVNTGVTVSARPVKMLNTQQYLDLRREAFKNDSITSIQGTNPFSPAYAPDLTIFDQNKSIDWYHNLTGKTTSTTNAHVSLSGGSTTTNFIVSGGITHVGYNFPGNYADNKLSLHSGFQHTSLDKRMSIDFTSDLGYERNNSAPEATLIRNILAPPNLPNLVDAEGHLIWDYKGYDMSTWQTESSLRKTSGIQIFNMNNSVRLSYEIISNLKITANLGYNRLSSVESQQDPASSQSPQSPQAMASFGNSTYQTMNIEPQLDYEKQFGKSNLTLLIAGSYKKSVSDQIMMQGFGYANDGLLGSITGAAVKYISDNSSVYKYAAVFGRVRYIYDQKYILNLTGSRDGSSNFGPGNQFGNFGSAGVGWIFSKEKGFKSALPFISYAKLSSNYGTSGSDAIAPYKFQAFWQPVANSLPFQGISPIVAVNLYNPDYSWDVKKSFNVALDFGFWQDKLLISGAWYQNRSGNQLVDYRLPVQTGFASVLKNLNATVQNRGWEFTLTSTNISNNNFRWESSLNISGNTNKLLAFPGLETSSYASIYTIGKSVNLLNVIRYKGVNPQTGLFEFLDNKGGVTDFPNGLSLAEGGDALPLVDNTPKFFGGLGNNLSYKNISLSVFFEFSKQTNVNYLASLNHQQPPGGLTNEPAAILKRWQKSGDISDIQRLTTTYSPASERASFFTISTGAYSDASYIRLKTVALSYSLPASLLKKIKVKSCNVFINAQNLLTITGYKVGDPQSAGGLFIFPLQRIIVSGLSLNF